MDMTALYGMALEKCRTPYERSLNRKGTKLHVGYGNISRCTHKTVLRTGSARGIAPDIEYERAVVNGKADFTICSEQVYLVSVKMTVFQP